MKTRPTVCLVAWDVSADQNAARLATAMRARSPKVRLCGIGGRHQQEAGVELLLHTTHLSFTGVLGALRHLPTMVAAYRKALAVVDDLRPDLAVLVDAEVAGCPFAVALRRRGIPTAFFFPPPVWFWGAWRAPWISPLAKRAVSVFRPEADIYERAGIDTVWIGHPLRDAVKRHDQPEIALRAIGIDPDKPLVVLMPGSRRNEIARLLEPFLAAARLLRARNSDLQFALPIASENLRHEIEGRVHGHGLGTLSLYHPTSYDVLGAADLVLQSSGTATLETGLLGVPSVVAYRLIGLEYLVARLLMQVPFISLPNILLGEMVQPEFFQHHVDAEHLAAAAWSILSDEAQRAAMRAKLARLPELLGPPGALDRAARAILELVPDAAVVLADEETAVLSSVA
ncbi:MAG: lipid-A-disaccharide synthase [Deltaproteobacteria bacterium]|nr:lipid-A-disaccharide synthase [Deltaproteobacteria bacterium]